MGQESARQMMKRGRGMALWKHACPSFTSLPTDQYSTSPKFYKQHDVKGKRISYKVMVQVDERHTI